MNRLGLILFLIVFALSIYANTSRVYVQKIVSPLFDLPSTYVTNSQQLRNVNYIFTAKKTHSSNILSTETDPFSVISIFKMGNDAVAYLDLGEFDTKWSINDTVFCTVKFVQDGIYNGQSRYWTMIIPDEMDSPIEMLGFSREETVPPLMLNSLPATNPTPSNNVNISPGRVRLSWEMNSSGSQPVGYIVKYANTKEGLRSAKIVFIKKNYLDIQTTASLEYYWQVMPSPLVLRKNVTTMPFNDEIPIWHFTTKNK